MRALAALLGHVRDTPRVILTHDEDGRSGGRLQQRLGGISGNDLEAAWDPSMTAKRSQGTAEGGSVCLVAVSADQVRVDDLDEAQPGTELDGPLDRHFGNIIGIPIGSQPDNDVDQLLLPPAGPPYGGVRHTHMVRAALMGSQGLWSSKRATAPAVLEPLPLPCTGTAAEVSGAGLCAADG